MGNCSEFLDRKYRPIAHVLIVLFGVHYLQYMELIGARYSIPGIGYVSYQSMVAGDIPFSMFYLVFMAVLTLIGNLISDILYAVVDPRVRIA